MPPPSGNRVSWGPRSLQGVRAIGGRNYSPAQYIADNPKIDRPSFGHAHFRPADERGNIGRIGVVVADKTPALF
jgi:hypothetical protein